MALAVALEPKPPLHEYEFPPVAVKLMDMVVQFNSVVLDEIAAVGTTLSKVVVAEVVAVHPLLPVTVTVKVPAVVVVIAAVVAPVLHK